MYRGRQFNIFEPLVGGFTKDNFKFNQYGLREKMPDGLNLQSPTLVWRAIGRSSDQRTLISAMLPENCWCDNNVWAVQHHDVGKLESLSIILSSTAIDFLVKLSAGGNVTLGVVASIPISNYESAYISKAKILLSRAKKKNNNTKIKYQVDALVWLHYGLFQQVINIENIKWILETQFKTLLKYDPEYVSNVIEYIIQYKKEINVDNVQSRYFTDQISKSKEAA